MIHVLLVIAVVMIILHLVTGRRALLATRKSRPMLACRSPAAGAYDMRSRRPILYLT